MCTGHGNLSFPLINKVLSVVVSEHSQVVLNSYCSIHYRLGGSRGHAPPGNFIFFEPQKCIKFCTIIDAVITTF